MLKLKYDTKKHIYEQNRLTDTYIRLVVAKGEKGRGGKDWELGNSKYKLLYSTGTIFNSLW